MDKVCKPFTVNGKDRITGEILEADSFRNLDKLREYRYLAPYEGEVIECDVCGRKFAEDEALQKHLDIEHEDVVQVDYDQGEIEDMLDEIHTGNGWYQIVEGENKVNGRENARERLIKALENNEEVA